MISAILLAAGKSERMNGENKLIKKIQGVPTIKHSINNILASYIDVLIIVLGYQKKIVQNILNENSKIKFVTNENFSDKEIQLFINNINVGNNICSVNSKENEVYTFRTSIPTYGMHKCYFLLNNVEKYYFNINIQTI